MFNQKILFNFPSFILVFYERSLNNCQHLQVCGYHHASGFYTATQKIYFCMWVLHCHTSIYIITPRQWVLHWNTKNSYLHVGFTLPHKLINHHISRFYSETQRISICMCVLHCHTSIYIITPVGFTLKHKEFLFACEFYTET